MLRRIFRHRQIKKHQRQLPPIPKENDWSADEEDNDKSYHIYEEIAEVISKKLPLRNSCPSLSDHGDQNGGPYLVVPIVDESKGQKHKKMCQSRVSCRAYLGESRAPEGTEVDKPRSCLDGRPKHFDESYLLPRASRSSRRSPLRADDREDTDSSENYYEYDVSGLSGSDSSADMRNYDVDLATVEQNFRHCQQIMTVVQQRRGEERVRRRSTSEENLDAVSLTTVSSLSLSSSLSTLASYGGASDGDDSSLSDFDPVARVTSAQTIIQSGGAHPEMAKRPARGRSSRPASRQRSDAGPIQEFRLTEMGPSSSMAKELCSSSSSSRRLANQPSPRGCYHGGQTRNNRLLNELIRLNHEKLQLQHL